MGNEPNVAAGEPIIQFCPLCGVKYIEPIDSIVKQTCPENGGCGQTFSVRGFSE